MITKPVNAELYYAYQVCSQLNLTELLDLSMRMAKDKASEKRDILATAISAVMQTKYTGAEERLIQMN